MNRSLLISTIIGTGILSINNTFALQPKPANADVIVQWNLITVKATKIAKQNSNLASRTEAVEAIAVYDAVNSIKHIGTPYHYNVEPSGPASAQAAVVQAAHDVLVNYFPAQRPALDSALTNSLQGITDGPVSAGREVGAAAAADIIVLRANDGSSPLTTYAGPEKPGVGAYRPTPGKFAPGIDVEWGNVKPFLLKSDKQFLPEPPPAIGSTEYKKALAEVNELGEIKSTKRTEDQTHIAQFYKQDAELTVNEGARLLAVSHGTTLEENALIFVLVDIAEADARIEIWGGKYKYLAWRPVTALNAEEDGSVKAYTKWTPLITTPAHPSYPSGHSATVTAGYEVLKKFFGDKNHLELRTTTDGEPARVVESLSAVEFENGYSRIYGGIHYAFENNSAQDVGRKVADWVLKNGPHKK
ncbi:vanadium-dependent haloperoxidase [Mucilaginibacter sp. OK098]|uniref:vanadium-dependent haloperoxidase n=1 Tax=Mucilaginibacter sp. OK098 TaxID=1855297 RepID=UPI00091F2875|nr:vanadium-dependent haloperoxidase [Mucilaginibacter sp. OK098]SHM16639.1 PAP2 superfamily protein [Mucilaginibacter sp. OK098]